MVRRNQAEEPDGGNPKSEEDPPVVAMAAAEEELCSAMSAIFFVAHIGVFQLNLLGFNRKNQTSRYN